MTRRIEDHVDLDDVLALVRCDCASGIVYWREREVTNWRIKAWNKRFAGTSAGQPNSKGRVQIPITIGGVKYFVLRHRLIWAAFENEWLPTDVQLDHRDRQHQNDTISNLRPSTLENNAKNRSLGKNNTSGYKGVYWIKKTSRWLAAVCVDKKFVRLGYFVDVKDAARAYDAGAEKYHREYAATNSKLGLLQ